MSAILPAPAVLLREAIADPRVSARRMIAANLPADVVWGALVLASVLSVLLIWVTLGGFGQIPPVAPGTAGLPSPIMLAVMQAAFTLLGAATITIIGARFGGKGEFGEVLVVMVWMQILLVVVQAVQTFAGIILAPLAGLVGLASVGLFFWLLTNFVAEVHGFRHLWRVFFGLVVGLMAFGLALFAVLVALMASLGGAG